MKKSKLIIIPIIAAIVSTAVGCSAPEADGAPVFDGIEQIDCLVGQSVDLLDRVRAFDAEDGDITGATVITVDGARVDDGIVTFDKPGTYKANFSVTDSAGNAAADGLDITVHPREVYRAFELENGFVTEHSGAGTVSGGVKNGKYNVTATGCDSDRIALVREFEADKAVGSSIIYRFTSDVAGKAEITVNDIATEVDIAVGSNTVSADYTANGDGITTAFELGGLANAFVLDFDSVEIASDGFVERCGADFVFEDTCVTAAFNGDRIEKLDWGVAEDKSSGFMTVTPAAGERKPWYAKMFIHTGVILKRGQRYKVAFDATAEHGQDFEVAFNARNAEKKASDRDEAMYGLHVAEGEAQTFTYDGIIAPESDRGELWIQIALGQVPDGFDSNTITVSDLSVRVVKAGVYGFEDCGLTGKFDAAHGASGTMSVENGVLHYSVRDFADVDWANEISSKPFSVDDISGSYVMSFTASSTVPVTAVFVIPTFGGWDPTLTWQRIVIGTEEKEYRFLIDSVANEGPYFLVFQFGGFNTGIHDADIRISNISLEVKSEYEKF